MGTFPNINNTYATVLCTTIGLPVKLALLHFAIMNCLPGHRRAAAIAGALVLKNMIGVFHFYTWIMRGSLSYGNIGDVFISKLMDNDSEFGRIGGVPWSPSTSLYISDISDVEFLWIGWPKITNMETAPVTWPWAWLRTRWRTRAASWKTSAGGLPRMMWQAYHEFHSEIVSTLRLWAS